MKKLLAGIAVGLGTAVFLVWYVLEHQRNKRDAELFIAGNHPERQQVLDDIGVIGETFEERVCSLRQNVEEQTREELIEMFKNIFGVGDGSLAGRTSITDKLTESDDSGPTSNTGG